MNKAQLRAHLVGKLRTAAQRPAERQRASEAICASICAHPAWANARLICAFFPLPSEPQIAPLWAEESVRVFCFPRVVDDRVELIRLDDPAHRAAATWKLDAPHHATAPIVAPESVDLFLVPGLAFTPQGARLGRGGGFYDRLLAHRSPHSIALGVCFAVQLVPEVPREEHDLAVDDVITEERG